MKIIDIRTLDRFNPADHDDDQDTDHLARLADDDVLAQVLEVIHAARID